LKRGNNRGSVGKKKIAIKGNKGKGGKIRAKAEIIKIN